MEKLEIGKTRYTDLKKFLSEIVHLTGFEKIRERLKKLIPHLIKTENNGVWVDIQDILSSHLSATIEYLTDYDKDSLDFENLQTKWTLGHDGSGGHAEYRSCNMDTKNLNLGGIRLIEVHANEKLIYREENFGQETEVPIFIGKF